MATRINGISIVEPLSETDKIKIIDNGEALLSLKKHCPKLILKDEPDSAGGPRVFYLRESLIEMLNTASRHLPRSHKLVIWSCYRTLEYQTFIYNMVMDQLSKDRPKWPFNILRRETNRFVHPPHAKTPPGHCTGGAVDLTIAGPDGEELDMSAPYGPEREQMRLVAATEDPKITKEARENRQMLAESLKPTKLTNYAGEWWHWSYGDSCWAWRAGRKTALYGVAEPTEEILKVLNSKAK